MVYKTFGSNAELRSDLLLRPAFLISLALLLANDLYLKYEFGNFYTGKLSDFAGLFMFPYFIATFKLRSAKAIYFTSAFAFLFWKSEFSQFIIAYFQNLGIGTDRVVDYTDLSALIILPVSYKYLLFQLKELAQVRKVYTIPLSGICLFAMTATTLQHREVALNLPVGKRYELAMSKPMLFKILGNERSNMHGLARNWRDSTFYLHFDSPDCHARLMALATIKAIDKNMTFIRLDTIVSADITGGIFTAPDEKFVRSLTSEHFEKSFEQDFLEAVKSGDAKYIYYDLKVPDAGR